MEILTHISLSPRTRKYNDTLRKKLSAAGINFIEKSTRRGWTIMVPDEDVTSAFRILLSTSL